MSIFWELWQQSRINDAEASASRAVNTARSEARQAEVRLAARLDNIVLAQAAMWAIIKEHCQLTDQHLMDKMEEIDIADGVRDGRITAESRPAQVCPACKRRSAEHHDNCMYCGVSFGLRQPFGG